MECAQEGTCLEKEDQKATLIRRNGGRVEMYTEARFKIALPPMRTG